jgi:hypothetical protein
LPPGSFRIRFSLQTKQTPLAKTFSRSSLRSLSNRVPKFRWKCPTSLFHSNLAGTSPPIFSLSVMVSNSGFCRANLKVNRHKSEFRHRFPHRTSSAQTVDTAFKQRPGSVHTAPTRLLVSHSVYYTPLNLVLCSSGKITFGELTSPKSPICILGCYGNVRLHQTSTRVLSEKSSTLTKPERKGQRAPETPRTNDGLQIEASRHYK